MGKRCSIACIIPPVLLEELARKGTDDERDAALAHALAGRHAAPGPNVTTRWSAAPVNSTTVLQSITAGQPQRTIYDCHEQEPVTNPEVVRGEGGPATDDSAVNEAYDGLGDTYNFYWDQFKRDSIDDQGMPLHGWVHYGHDYDNAFWDGQRDGVRRRQDPSTASPSRST